MSKQRSGKHANSKITANGHAYRDAQAGRPIHGRGPSTKRSILLVPELRKRRGKRDPVRLRKQQEEARRRIATGEV